MKLIAFDLGDTLVEYEGLPMSWEQYYLDALHELASLLGVSPDSKQLKSACNVLKQYNTRIVPRNYEVQFTLILSEILRCFVFVEKINEAEAARVFFNVFRQRLRCFDDSIHALTVLRNQGFKTGVFSDVPYGMPAALVLEDISITGLDQLLDYVVTSSDAGFRKPSPEALKHLAEASKCNASEMTYIGNERKDIEAAKAFGCFSILLDRSKKGSSWGQDRTITSLKEI